MIDETDTDKVRTLLSKNRQGMSISEIASNLGTNRSSSLNILNYLVGSGEVSMRTFGRAKVYTLTSRIPVARLMSLSSDLFLIMDNDLYIENFNDAFGKIFHVDREGIIGSNILFTNIPDMFSADIIQALRDAAQGERREFETYIQTEDSLLFYKGTCIPIQESEFSSWVALVMQDLSLYKKYEGELETAVKARTAELVASENRFRVLTEMAPVGIFETDAKGLVTYVNQAWIELSGLPFNQAMGNGWKQAVHAEDREWIQKAWGEYIGNPGPWSHLFRLLNGEGRTLSVLTMVRATIDKSNTISGYIGTVIDLTHRIDAEVVIGDLCSRMQTILEDANDGIATLDTERIITSCNKAGCKILGYSKEDLIGKNSRILYQSDDYYKNMEKTAYGRLMKKGHYRGKIEIIRGDGAIRTIEVSLSILYEKGKNTGVIKIFRELSDKL